MVNTPAEHSETEKKILEAAKKVLLKKGLHGARMQAIADEAKINKALLHYYFRNKEQIFKIIFAESAKELFSSLHQVLSKEGSLEVKVYQIVEGYIDFLKRNPYLPVFVLQEINQNPDMFLSFMKEKVNPMSLLQQLTQEVGKRKKKTGNNNAQAHFLVNMLSMMIFPIIAKPMMKHFLQMNEKAYSAFLDERKQLIPKILLHDVSDTQ